MWRELLHINFEDLGLLEEENVETFWEVIFKTKRGDETKAFPNLKKKKWYMQFCQYLLQLLMLKGLFHKLILIKIKLGTD